MECAMEEREIDVFVEKQREYFASGETLNIKFRIEKLRQLKSLIIAKETEICEALRSDLGKSSFESYMCEVGMVLSELTYMIKHTKKFAKKRKVKTPMAQFASKSYKLPTPLGNVLIMSPWNYPFLLTIDPLVDAIASGNTVVVKPSAYSPATSQVIKEILNEVFEDKYVAVVTGGRKENASLLKKKFDFIFFTGSQSVGREVLKYASDHLTPVVLELGGKSPCIVDDSADIALSAKRIVFGKFLNCGQTCVAPDYILCDSKIKDKLVEELVNQVKLQYGESPLDNTDYGKIINEKHYERILKLIDTSKVVIGGNSNTETMQIEPTIMDNVTYNDAVMQEEIFGPVLPILTYDKFDEVYSNLTGKDKPLALYLFSKNSRRVKEVTNRISYGGGCVNDTIIHLATSEMGFGGVGESGMGTYHGKAGFDTFSHIKSIVDKKTWIDLPMRYQPYKSNFFKKLVRFFLK